MSSTELTLALQRELRRVGCYQGEINGEWTQSTRRAMDALVDRVNASLPIDKPDGVLLALVQNQKSMVCGNACPGGQVITQGGRCIPQSVAARSSSSVKAAEGVQTTRSASVTKNDWSVVATRDVPVPSPAPAPLPGRMAIGAPVAADDLTASVAGAPPAVIVYEHVPQRAEPTATVYPPPARRAQSSGGASKGMPSWAARAFAY